MRYNQVQNRATHQIYKKVSFSLQLKPSFGMDEIDFLLFPARIKLALIIPRRNLRNISILKL